MDSKLQLVMSVASEDEIPNSPSKQTKFYNNYINDNAQQDKHQDKVNKSQILVSTSSEEMFFRRFLRCIPKLTLQDSELFTNFLKIGRATGPMLLKVPMPLRKNDT